MSKLMKAAVLVHPGEVVMEQRPVPTPGPGHVLVRIASVGVCGSDTHYFEHGRIGQFVVNAPLVLGHEASGTIEAVGEGVDPDRVGQRVSIEPGIPDLTCQQCLAGRYNLCPNMRFFATPPIDGAFAQYALTHHAFAHPLPGSVSDNAGALLEPLSVALWACRKAGVRPGRSVLITGAGPVGLLALQCALAHGATQVTVADVNPYRLEVAANLGASATVDLRDGGEPFAMDSTAELGAHDALLECSGHPGATIQGLYSLTPAGTAVLVGMGTETLPLPLGLVQERELKVTGTFRYANTWPTAIALAQSGRIALDELVTGTFSLERTAQALVAARTDPRALKSVVRP